MKNRRLKVVSILIASCLASPAYGESEVRSIGESFGEDSEFGVVEEIAFRKSNWEPWRIQAWSDYHYLDNVRYIDNLAPLLADFIADEDDVVFRSGVSVEYTPLITDNLFLDASLSQDFSRFDKLDQLDFDFFAGNLGLIYVVQELRDLQLFARYRYENLTAATFEGPIYANNALEIGAQQVYRFAPGQLIFGELKSHIALDGDPNIARYNEYNLNVGYQWEVDPFEVMLCYRIAYLAFDGIDRSDWNQIVSLRGEYHLRDWVSLVADTSFSLNSSTLDPFDYEAFAVGVGFSLEFTF